MKLTIKKEIEVSRLAMRRAPLIEYAISDFERELRKAGAEPKHSDYYEHVASYGDRLAWISLYLTAEFPIQGPRRPDGRL